MSNVGTTARGIKTPIIKKGDDLVKIVVDSIITASQSDSFKIEDNDIVAVTEAVVAIAQGNYATTTQIANDIKTKYNSNHLGLVFPILSRNRFSVLLRAIAKATKKLTILLSYPKDEVGNSILDEALLDKLGVNPYSDIISESEYHLNYSSFKHPFTGVNMVEYYRNICSEENTEVQFVFANDPREITKYTNNIIVASIHNRNQIRNLLAKDKQTSVYSLDQILTASIENSGYNPDYGLLGSNVATKDSVKLFPRDVNQFVNQIQAQIKKMTNQNVEVLVYGDGAFKDPINGIWELADPVVSPGYTKGLEGSPNELKIKFLADNKFSDLKGEKLNQAIKDAIKQKESDLTGQDASLGTTPRRYVDLIGSLCDLVSGSGDKGTPVVYIKNYFTNYLG